MKKNDQNRQDGPAVLHPVVIQDPPTFAFQADAISSLEEAGGIELSSSLVRSLTDLAHDWLLQERIDRSPRPSDFRKRLEQLRTSLEGTNQLPAINGADATQLDRHFLNWAINVPGASDFYAALESVRDVSSRLRRILEVLETALPKEAGRARKRDDIRLMLRLVEIYETAGGVATIYYSGPRGSTSDTPFRRFADEFYHQLPLRHSRADVGFHTVLAQAIRTKRKADGNLARG